VWGILPAGGAGTGDSYRKGVGKRRGQGRWSGGTTCCSNFAEELVEAAWWVEGNSWGKYGFIEQCLFYSKASAHFRPQQARSIARSLVCRRLRRCWKLESWSWSWSWSFLVVQLDSVVTTPLAISGNSAAGRIPCFRLPFLTPSKGFQDPRSLPKTGAARHRRCRWCV